MGRALFFLLVFFGAVSAPAAGPPFARVIYSNATLIDGTGGPPRMGMAVIVNDERIEDVVPVAQLTPELRQGAMLIDLTGLYLLPGLIDSHQHLATPPNRRRAEALLRRDLYSGITATRVMADDLRSIAELDRAARTGEIASPDLWYAAVFAGRSFFGDPRTAAVSFGYTPGEAPWAQAIDASTDLRLAVARAQGTGAAAVKIYADLPPDVIRALAEEARRQGMMVWAHGMVFPTPPDQVIAANPDTISHTCYLAYQVSERRPATYRERFPVDAAAFSNGDHPAMERLFAAMRAQGVLLDATLRVYREGERRATRERPALCSLDLAARLTAEARRAGVLVSAGTDGDTPHTAPYPGLFDELELLVQRAGFSPLEAIRSATQIGAMTMGKGQSMGVVAPGYLANLVVLERDPLADIANMRSVQFTVKRGRRYDRADYRPITAEEAGADED
ncbi:MAG TPA: amidohydrolase family protein [Allosphingosinicella sp.]|nr:amidohydrolase family protein [Allosphingosinicella sp.]